MKAERSYGQGISFPPRLGSDGRFSWSSGAQNIRESIHIILMTKIQERLMLPEFGGGLESFLYEPNITATHRLIQHRVTQAINRWEPRIKLISVNVSEDPNDIQTANITILYRLIATGLEDQVDLAITLS